MNIDIRTNLKDTTQIKSRWKKIKKDRPAEAEYWGKRLILVMVICWLLTFLVSFEMILTIMNAVGILFAIIGLKRKALGLLGIAILCTLDSLTRTFLLSGGLFRWNTVNYWLLLVILINFTLFLRFNDINTRLLQWLLILMVLMLSISLFFESGVQSILNIGTVFGIMIYFARALKEKDTLYWMGMLCGVTGAIGGAAFYLQAEKLPYLNPNSFSQFPLIAMFAVCLALPNAIKNKRGRFFFLLMIVINLFWVFISGSRGSLLTGFVCVICFVLILRNFSWITLFIIIGICATYWLSTTLLDQQVVALNRIEKLFDQSYTLAQRTSGRSDIAWTGWQIFLKQPVGIGTGSFKEGASFLNIAGGKERAAHSGWIKTLAENGVLGFILMFAWVVSFFFKGIRSDEHEKKITGLLVTLVLAVSFISKEFQGKDLWFLVAGAVIQLNSEQYLKLFTDYPDLLDGVRMKKRRRIPVVVTENHE